MSDPRDTLICALLVDAMRADDELCRLRKVESDLLTLIEGVMDAALKRKPGLPRAWFDAAEKMMGCSQGQTLAAAGSTLTNLRASLFALTLPA